MTSWRGEVWSRLEGVAAGSDGVGSAKWRMPSQDRALSVFLLVLPGIWVAVVLALEVVAPARVQLAPLLAAAPAIACAATGRRQCVLLAGLCALFALLPWGPGSPDAGFGQRVGTFGAILSVVIASFVISVRRQRAQRDLSHVQAIAEVAQRVLLRPPAPEVGDVWVAARYASATAGAVVGGDFYDVVDTPFGVRAVIGDVRGSGLGAVECASVLLGSFREAAYDEPDLRDLVRRLDVSLRRHLGQGQPGPLTAPHRLWEATNVLTATMPLLSLDVREEFASVAVVCVRPDGMLELVNCGHPDPYLICSGIVTPFHGDSASLPLGFGGLVPLGEDRPSVAVAPFESGDSLLLFTDGVTRVRAADGGSFQLSETLWDLADANPDYVVSAIHAEVTARSRGPRVDDLALLFLHRP